MDRPDLADLPQLCLQAGDAAANQAAVRFQLGLAGAAGADAAFLPLQVGPHARQPGQQILILGQLHLEASLPGLGPLSKDIQNQRAAVYDLYAGHLLQSPILRGGQVVVQDDHVGLGGCQQLLDLLDLTLPQEAVGIRGGTALQDLGRALAAGGLQEGLQLVQGSFGGVFVRGKNPGVQAAEYCGFRDGLLQIFHHFSKFFTSMENARTGSVRA